MISVGVYRLVVPGVVLAAGSLAYAVYVGSECIIHRSMTRDFSKKLARGTYRDFLLEMGSHEWERQSLYPRSYFDRSTDSRVHAGILQFNGRGMLLGPVDWWRVSRWLRKQNSSRKVVEGRWGR